MKDIVHGVSCCRNCRDSSSAEAGKDKKLRVIVDNEYEIPVSVTEEEQPDQPLFDRDLVTTRNQRQQTTLSLLWTRHHGTQTIWKDDLPVSEWTSGDVRQWLGEIAVPKYQALIDKRINGIQLLGLKTKKDLEKLRVDSKHSDTLWNHIHNLCAADRKRNQEISKKQSAWSPTSRRKMQPKFKEDRAVKDWTPTDVREWLMEVAGYEYQELIKAGITGPQLLVLNHENTLMKDYKLDYKTANNLKDKINGLRESESKQKTDERHEDTLNILKSFIS